MNVRYETHGPHHACVYLDDTLVVGPLPRREASCAGHDLHRGWPSVLLWLRLRPLAIWCVRARTEQRMSYGPLGIARPDLSRIHGRDPWSLALDEIEARLRRKLKR